MAKPRGTDGSLLQSLPWTLAALAVAIAPHAQFLPAWIIGAFIFCAGWRLLIERRRRALPPMWIRAGLALTCFLGVFATYSTISGVGPGSALLAIMAALKLLETRKRRDQFVLLFIAMFLIMSSLLREQHMWSLPYLIVALLLVMTAWLRVSDVARVRPSHSLYTSSRFLMYAAPVAIAMWIFFPRIATPFWAVPMDTGTATTGISDTMSPGDISSLSLSNAVAFRVKFEGEIPEQRNLYWRGLVMTIFNGRTWTQNDPYEGPRVHEMIRGVGETVNYEITLEPTRQQWVFALDMPTRWSLSRTFMGPQQQLARARTIDQRIAYDVESFLNYRTEVELTDYARSWYERLPDNSNERTRQLAQEMHAAADSDEAYVTSVLRMFNQEEFFYTLQPPRLGSDPIDRFLFDTRRGFCEHYASAFAVMMRAAGIPARIVLGYHGGEVNPMGGHLIVRQSDAHAWNEVWLPEAGWHRVDPTSAVAPERIDAGASGAALGGAAAAWGLAAPSALLHRLTLTWDALNARWNEFVLGYGPENQERFMRWLGMDEPDWQKMVLTMIGLVAALVGIISLLLMLRLRTPPRDRAAILYGRFVRRTGVEPKTGETPLAFAARAIAESSLPADAIRTVTSVYLDARYGPTDAAALQRLETAISSARG